MVQPLPRGKHGLSRDVVDASQRSRILDAIIAAVVEHGYAVATVTDVNVRSRVSRISFYEHFSDKETCFVAAFTALFDELIAVALGAFGSGGAWPDRLATALSALLETLQDDRGVARICFVESRTAGRAADRARSAQVQRFGVLFRPSAVVESRPAEALTTQVLAGGLADSIYRSLAATPDTDLRDLLPAMLHPALVMRLGPDEAIRQCERLCSG